MQVFACKIIAKRLGLPNVSNARQLVHIANVKREVDVLRRLRGSLSVVQLEAVYEDDDAVYIVMERCTGGELWHPRGQRPYTEQTVRLISAVARMTANLCGARWHFKL